MSRNTRADWMNFVQENPAGVIEADGEGYTRLHREAIAGNLSSIEILVANGADVHAKNKHGKTALEYAQAMGWEHLGGHEPNELRMGEAMDHFRSRIEDREIVAFQVTS